MAFDNFLNQLLPPPGSSPGFAGGHFGGIGQGPMEQWQQPPINEMSGIREALAQNAMRPQPKKQGRSFGDILGMLGDAISIGAGGQPLWHMRRQQKQDQQRNDQIQSALSNYMDDPEGSIRALLQIDAPTAIKLLQDRQGKEPPADAQLYEYRNRLPDAERQSFDKFLELRRFNPYGAPITLGPNDTFEQGGQQAPAPGAVEEGFIFKGGNPADPNSWEPVNGGPTATPSAPFPQ